MIFTLHACQVYNQAYGLFRHLIELTDQCDVGKRELQEDIIRLPRADLSFLHFVQKETHGHRSSDTEPVLLKLNGVTSHFVDGPSIK